MARREKAPLRLPVREVPIGPAQDQGTARAGVQSLLRATGRNDVQINLTAEVLLPQSYLPRDEFLGGVVRSAHGADAARAGVAGEIEGAEVALLPDQSLLVPSGTVVQPDGVTAVLLTIHLGDVRCAAMEFLDGHFSPLGATALKNEDGTALIRAISGRGHRAPRTGTVGG